MKKYTQFVLIFLLGAGFWGSCAKNQESTLNEDNKIWLDGWIQFNHPGVQPSGKGIYIIEDQPGTGKEYKNDAIISVEYTVTDLNGNIVSTTSKELSQQLGSYNYSDYYGERIWVIGEGSVVAGVEDILDGMKIGGTRKAVIPSWLNVNKRYNSAEEYFKHNSKQPHAIYSITLKNIIEDLEKWETDSLKRYSEKHLGGIDTTSFGFYYKQTKKPVIDSTFKKDTNIFINYIGRRLDGTVFDTNIADTAKVYEIYNPARKYVPAQISWGENETDLKMVTDGKSSGLIQGFQKTLWQMHPMEQGIGVFISRFGYSVAGSGQAIPSCCPLRFDIEIVQNPEKK